jgi:hypothetical protein
MYFEFRKAKAIAPQTNVLTVQFVETLGNYIDYELTIGDALNITTVFWTGAKNYNHGIESLHAHAKDPLPRMDKD